MPQLGVRRADRRAPGRGSVAGRLPSGRSERIIRDTAWTVMPTAALVMIGGAALAVGWPAVGWLSLGGLAGYSLSGSV